MGKYPDTNNQFAYKNDRCAFLKGIRDRADQLWNDGYRVSPMEEKNTYLVIKEGEECGHKVNPVTRQCSCKFHTDQYHNPLDPNDLTLRIPCKHVVGCVELIKQELCYWQMRLSAARATIAPNTGSADRATSYLLICNRLALAWETTEEELHDACSSWEEAENMGLLTFYPEL